MVIKEKVQDAINKQINRELYSAYLYLAMAAYFEAKNFRGFAHWMEKQAQEEVKHAMKFYKYVTERGGRVVLLDVEAPPKDWKSHLEVFEEVYKHEMKVTELINNVLKIAKEEHDAATEIALQWFITEQVEEEDSALAILEQLKMIKESSNALFMLDHQLAKRE